MSSSLASRLLKAPPSRTAISRSAPTRLLLRRPRSSPNKFNWLGRSDIRAFLPTLCHRLERALTMGDRTQTMYSVVDGAVIELSLPAPDTKLLGEIRWGSFDELLTPAYWKGQAWQHDELGTYRKPQLGRSLREEVAACLLGGYGMPAELGLAAYERLRRRGLLDGVPVRAEVENALMQPLLFRDGSRRRYRFPQQKALYLVAALERMVHFEPPQSDLDLRDSLVGLPGVGPKTASWVVRNHRDSDAVAIIDIHILRAGQHLGLFPQEWTPQHHYGRLESSFLKFARALGVRASLLDSLIWDYMRCLGPIARHPSQ